MSLPTEETKTEAVLPTEFTLQLGPQSSAQLDAVARVLEALGATVERDAENRLVAVRPL